MFLICFAVFCDIINQIYTLTNEGGAFVSKKLIEVVDQHGTRFMIDNSNEECQKLGYKPGEKIKNVFNHKIGKVVGVSPVVIDKNKTVSVLWVEFEIKPGVVYGYHKPKTFFRERA